MRKTANPSEIILILVNKLFSNVNNLVDGHFRKKVYVIIDHYDMPVLSAFLGKFNNNEFV